MSSFTPGPWGLSNGPSIWVMAGHLHVATIPRAYDGDWSPANARLIAAAPEMLDQHRANARMLDLVIHDLQGRIEDVKIMALRQCLDRSLDAIAKATGGAA